MKFELTPLQAEKAIEALKTMHEQTDRLIYLGTADNIQEQLEKARAETKQQEPASLFLNF